MAGHPYFNISLLRFSRLLQHITVRTQQEARLPLMPQTIEPTPDEQLAQQAHINKNAFAELYHRHVTRVYRYHLARTGNIHDAEDLTSQTFLAALEGIRSFRGDGSFAAWLMGIASRRRALLFRGRRPEVPIEAALHVPTSEASPETNASNRLQMESVSRALRQISRDRAEAILLCLISGLTCAEAAKSMQKSEAAVKMLLSRGLRDLRERTSLALEVEK
ncbi:MAG: RNA polymerase sigma factor [Anaerolineaceae bacterium]|nr:MAG: RNA polymerase sigma factor [Anaerolineaceae bacterium]